jgi:hypothetical protein
MQTRRMFLKNKTVKSTVACKIRWIVAYPKVLWFSIAIDGVFGIFLWVDGALIISGASGKFQSLKSSFCQSISEYKKSSFDIVYDAEFCC